MLWFAFILLSLSYWQQLIRTTIIYSMSCDLLSFYYLCRTDNNHNALHIVPNTVVICFHFTIFVVLTTTVLHDVTVSVCCDLLSFYYLCRTDNNIYQTSNPQNHVVICFHFTIFVVLTTTLANKIIFKWGLWFAFILLSLVGIIKKAVSDWYTEWNWRVWDFR